jgi:hypothetical protein
MPADLLVEGGDYPLNVNWHQRTVLGGGETDIGVFIK